MNLFVDDERPAPPGWLLATGWREATEVLRICAAAGVGLDALSLDHDLGIGIGIGIGEETVRPLLEIMQAHTWWPSELFVHTGNEAAEARMLDFIRTHAPAGVLRGWGCNFWGTGPDSQIQNWEQS
ncbi:cyclic-phosphate processing receiver domain-containing protein [Rhodococcus marinonascens]|uniref:cyclic-phosphate processing receiver domain-containing protein n=1 Tax=Rhodococcus marinonascens TaxID=38311 RepID=UPI00093480E8|nr:cyclic-phosphate processing receiver domain-containing protein [Rhodococcus marinonascens]